MAKKNNAKLKNQRAMNIKAGERDLRRLAKATGKADRAKRKKKQ
jgi:hypothetical protein